MKGPDQHIDDALFEKLFGAEANAEGIDWTSFEKKVNTRRKRRLLIWFFSAFLFVVSAVIYFAGTGSQPETIASQEKQTIESAKPQRETPNKAPSTAENEEQDAPAKNGRIIEKKMMPDFPHAFTPSPETNSVAEKSAEHQILENNEIPRLVSAVQPAGGGFICFVNPMGIHAIAMNHRETNWPLELTMPAKETDKKITLPQLTWSLLLGPNISTPDFKTTAKGARFTHKDFASIRNRSEFGRMGFDLQFLLGISRKRFIFQAGFGMTQMDVQGDYDFIYSETPIINPDGTVVGYKSISPINVRYQSPQRYNFFQVPLQCQYQFLQRSRYQLGLNLGLANQFMFQISGILPNAVFLDKQDHLRNANFKPYSNSLDFSLPWSIKMNKSMQFIVSPYYRHSGGFWQIQSFYRSSFSNWGLNCGIKAGINK